MPARLTRSWFVGVADAQPRRVHGVQRFADAGAHGGALDRVRVGGLGVLAGADVLEGGVGDLQAAAVVEGVVGLDLAVVEADRGQGAVGVPAGEAHLERERVGVRGPVAGEEQVQPGDHGARVDVGHDLGGGGDPVVAAGLVPADALDLEADLVGRDRAAQVAGGVGGHARVGSLVGPVLRGRHGSS